ncbi:MAG TPA: hypothetical protein VHS96_11065, partial [Bacteroidia bacterium]|nr:hypothetical protein [Bacteroidia bacterium]
DATIRNNSNPANFTSNKIPAGTKVKRVRTFNNGAVAQVEVLSGTSAGTKYWTTFTNVSASETVTDSGNRYVSYSDTWLYNGPYGAILTTTTGSQTTNQSLAAGNTTAYTITERCGAFAKVKQGETEMGWIREGALMDQTTRDRSQYMADLETWLNARYGEASALAGDAKKDRIKGILSLIESVAHQLEGGTYPVITGLSTSPAYEAHTYTSYIPPELILAVRQFIVALEAGDPVAGATPAAGDEIDWNARLGVPQYRTQSDNLTPPEVTCGPTSFTMGAERLGYSRADMIQAIDTKLRESLAADATQEQVETKFEEKAEEFLESFAGASEGYQKLRGNNEGLAGNEDDLSEGFREWGQYEDLTYFLAWLNNIDRGNVASGSSQTMLDSLHDAQTGVDNAAGTNSSIVTFSSTVRFTHEHRKQIQDTLAAGGAVVLSLFHKGNQSGTHITTVREVTAEGLAMDDPYGQVNPGYRHGVAGDAFKDVGGSGGRSAYNWRNVPNYDASDPDYADRDFTESAAEELVANESRGQNEVLSWAQIEESTNLLNYLRFYTRR